MSASKEFKEALVGMSSDSASEDTRHPPVELLFEYQSGTLDAQREREIRNHLVACTACSESLLEIASFSQASESPGPDGTDSETEFGWRSLKRRLPFDRGRAGTRTGPARGRSFYPLAAAIIAALGLGLITIHQQRTTRALRHELTLASAARTNFPVVYLDATTREENETASLLELPTEDAFFVLMVAAPSSMGFEAFRVEILDSGGDLAATHDDLLPSEYGTLRLALSGQDLFAGDYSVKLFGITEEGRQPITAYPLQVRYRSSPQ